MLVMHVDIKNGRHNHKAIVAENSVSCACSICRSVFIHVSKLYELCSDLCCIVDIILHRAYSKVKKATKDVWEE